MTLSELKNTAEADSAQVEVTWTKRFNLCRLSKNMAVDLSGILDLAGIELPSGTTLTVQGVDLALGQMELVATVSEVSDVDAA